VSRNADADGGARARETIASLTARARNTQRALPVSFQLPLPASGFRLQPRPVFRFDAGAAVAGGTLVLAVAGVFVFGSTIAERSPRAWPSITKCFKVNGTATRRGRRVGAWQHDRAGRSSCRRPAAEQPRSSTSGVASRPTGGA
jgi:hypothetical protein